MTTTHKIKSIKIGLILIAALAIILVILAFFSPQDKKIEPNTGVNFSSKKESFNTKYSSQFFGYTFLYPSNLQLEAGRGLAYATDIRMDEYTIVNPSGIEFAKSDISEKNLIKHFIVPANKNGRNMLNHYIKNVYYPVKEKKNIKIGERPGKRYFLKDGRIMYTLEDDNFIHLFQVTSSYADSIFQNILPTFSFHEPIITSLESFPKEPSSVDVFEVELDNRGHELVVFTYLDKTQLQRHDYTIEPGDPVPGDSGALYKDDYSGIQFLQIFGAVENKWELLHSETIDYRKDRYSAVSEFQISPVKISNDLKAILVKKEAKPKTYFVFGISGDEYTMFPIQFGYKNLDSYLHKEESVDNQFKTVLEKISAGASENRILREVYQVSFENDKSQIPVRSFYVEQEYKNGQFIPHYVEQKILPEGYHVRNNYLFYGNKPTMGKSISEYLYSETNEGEEYGEWFRREDGENLFIYLYGGAGCGGCSWVLTDYFIIWKSDNHIQKGHLNNFAARGKEGERIAAADPTNGILSPDKTKFAFATNEGSEKEFVEMAKIYDFIQQTTKIVQKIEPNSTLVKCGASGCQLITGTVEWVNNETIKVLPRKKN